MTNLPWGWRPRLAKSIRTSESWVNETTVLAAQGIESVLT